MDTNIGTLFDTETTNCVSCGRPLTGTGCAWCNPPLLPYAGTSGWSGSTASKARAITNDSDGTTAKRQIETLNLIIKTGTHGMTVAELRTVTGWHHGQASGVLSCLHKEEKIARLTESRDRCKVYCYPDFVSGRDIESHGRKPRAANPDPVPVPPHSGPTSDTCPACGAGEYDHYGSL